MRLVYANPEQTTIRVTLDEGETFDDLVWPTEAFVPTDPSNRHYAAIQDQSLTVNPYEAPGG